MPANYAEPSIESLERIFQLITEAPKSRQESMLEELCPDPSVQRLVRELLEADSVTRANTIGFLNSERRMLNCLELWLIDL